MARRYLSLRAPLGVPSLELSRDIYGFTVRPHHLKRYREYADIYKVEEAERSERWEHFLRTYDEVPIDDLALDGEDKQPHLVETASEAEKEGIREKHELRRTEIWNPIRSSLLPIEGSLNVRTKKDSISAPFISGQKSQDHSEAAVFRGSNSGTAGDGLSTEDDSEEEFYDVERSDMVQDGIHFEISVADNGAAMSDHGQNELENISKSSSQLTHELEALVRQGVPMALRGELWQVFVGTRTRRQEGHYNLLLMSLASDNDSADILSRSSKYTPMEPSILEKWTSQIEKDLPRTFPGHPALDEDGRNALRRLLTAYACHNPDVGYCQAMNFFAALLLLMMPEENAFWTLTGILEDYFEGYYSEKMLEAQVDQFVLNELVRELLPKLVSHLDALGVQITWVTGPWFLSIFVNILPWDSVLRVWDVVLYEGNRSMLFRTALALLELHGPAIMATKDVGDAVAMLQSLAGGTFDSSQLVLLACMGYQMVNETRLQDLRKKYQPEIMSSFMQHSLDVHVWKSSHSLLTSKVFQSSESQALSGMHSVNNQLGPINEILTSGDVSKDLPYSRNKEGKSDSLTYEGESLPLDAADSSNNRLDNSDSSTVDLLEQIKWLKAELCQVLEENRAATLRAEELEIAFMELVQKDNRRLLSAKVETLEAEMASLRLSLNAKEEQDQAIVQVVLRMEQEQQLAEDARRFAEQDAVAQRHAVYVLQEKYDGALNALAEMEKRAVMAESMLEATLQYQALGSVQTPRYGIDSPMKEEESPKSLWSRIAFSSRPADSDSSVKGNIASSYMHKRDIEEVPKSGVNNVNTLQFGDPPRKPGLLSHPFVLSWRDKAKRKTGGQGIQLPTTSSMHENVPDQAALPSVSLLNEFDSSSQDPMSYKCETSVCGEQIHLNGSVASLETADHKSV